MREYSTVEDDCLVELANQGDKRAFDDLNDRHRRYTRSVCGMFFKSEDLCEDAVQETWIRAWKYRSNYQKRCSYRAWLRQIATNVCRDILRKRGIVVQLEEDIGSGSSCSSKAHTPNPEEVAAANAIFSDIMSRLSDDDARAVWLHYRDGFELREISSILGCPEGTLRARMLRTIKPTIKAVLQEHYDNLS